MVLLLLRLNNLQLLLLCRTRLIHNPPHPLTKFGKFTAEAGELLALGVGAGALRVDVAFELLHEAHDALHLLADVIPLAPNFRHLIHARHGCDLLGRKDDRITASGRRLFLCMCVSKQTKREKNQ